MVAYAKPQQRKKEESERLRGERYQVKFLFLFLIHFEQFMFNFDNFIIFILKVVLHNQMFKLWKASHYRNHFCIEFGFC